MKQRDICVDSQGMSLLVMNSISGFASNKEIVNGFTDSCIDGMFRARGFKQSQLFARALA